jgi:isocitrate dehydrogenase (NAD+)
VCFKGPLTVPPGNSSFVTVRGKTYTSANQVFRKVYGLYANIRPAKSVAGVVTPFPKTDLVIVRENTEDLYTGEERYVDDDTVEGIKRITRGASTRIAQKAWDFALKNGRKRITAVHKANVCKKADGLFLDACRAVAALPQHQGKGVTYDEQLCDSLLTRMVQKPEEYDILLCPNLFGDLVSDLAAGLIGSLGLMPSGQFGDGYAVFEPAHGSAPDIAGKGIVNPTSQIRAAAMMLEYLGEHEAAARLDAACVAVINAKVTITSDLGGTATTSEMTQAIIDKLTAK